jgi:hypothetical protein
MKSFGSESKLEKQRNWRLLATKPKTYTKVGLKTLISLLIHDCKHATVCLHCAQIDNKQFTKFVQRRSSNLICSEKDREELGGKREVFLLPARL